MGDIVFWTLVRITVSIPVLWILNSHVDSKLWLIIVVAVFFLFILYPAVISYRKFEQKSKTLIESSLCASCKYFEKSAVICIKHDKHPTENYIPCEGNHWEPK